MFPASSSDTDSKIAHQTQDPSSSSLSANFSYASSSSSCSGCPQCSGPPRDSPSSRELPKPPPLKLKAFPYIQPRRSVVELTKARSRVNQTVRTVIFSRSSQNQSLRQLQQQSLEVNAHVNTFIEPISECEDSATRLKWWNYIRRVGVLRDIVFDAQRKSEIQNVSKKEIDYVLGSCSNRLLVTKKAQILAFRILHGLVKNKKKLPQEGFEILFQKCIEQPVDAKNFPHAAMALGYILLCDTTIKPPEGIEVYLDQIIEQLLRFGFDQYAEGIIVLIRVKINLRFEINETDRKVIKALINHVSNPEGFLPPIVPIFHPSPVSHTPSSSSTPLPITDRSSQQGSQNDFQIQIGSYHRTIRSNERVKILKKIHRSLSVGYDESVHRVSLKRVLQSALRDEEFKLSSEAILIMKTLFEQGKAHSLMEDLESEQGKAHSLMGDLEYALQGQCYHALAALSVYLQFGNPSVNFDDALLMQSLEKIIHTSQYNESIKNLAAFLFVQLFQGDPNDLAPLIFDTNYTLLICEQCLKHVRLGRALSSSLIDKIYQLINGPYPIEVIRLGISILVCMIERKEEIGLFRTLEVLREGISDECKRLILQLWEVGVNNGIELSREIIEELIEIEITSSIEVRYGILSVLTAFLSAQSAIEEHTELLNFLYSCSQVKLDHYFQLAGEAVCCYIEALKTPLSDVDLERLGNLLLKERTTLLGIEIVNALAKKQYFINERLICRLLNLMSVCQEMIPYVIPALVSIGQNQPFPQDVNHKVTDFLNGDDDIVKMASVEILSQCPYAAIDEVILTRDKSLKSLTSIASSIDTIIEYRLKALSILKHLSEKSIIFPLNLMKRLLLVLKERNQSIRCLVLQLLLLQLDMNPEMVERENVMKDIEDKISLCLHDHVESRDAIAILSRISRLGFRLSSETLELLALISLELQDELVNDCIFDILARQKDALTGTSIQIFDVVSVCRSLKDRESSIAFKDESLKHFLACGNLSVLLHSQVLLAVEQMMCDLFVIEDFPLCSSSSSSTLQAEQVVDTGEKEDGFSGLLQQLLGSALSLSFNFLRDKQSISTKMIKLLCHLRGVHLSEDNRLKRSLFLAACIQENISVDTKAYSIIEEGLTTGIKEDLTPYLIALRIAVNHKFIPHETTIERLWTIVFDLNEYSDVTISADILIHLLGDLSNLNKRYLRLYDLFILLSNPLPIEIELKLRMLFVQLYNYVKVREEKLPKSSNEEGSSTGSLFEELGFKTHCLEELERYVEFCSSTYVEQMFIQECRKPTEQIDIEELMSLLQSARLRRDHFISSDFFEGVLVLIENVEDESTLGEVIDFLNVVVMHQELPCFLFEALLYDSKSDELLLKTLTSLKANIEIHPQCLQQISWKLHFDLQNLIEAASDPVAALSREILRELGAEGQTEGVAKVETIDEKELTSSTEGEKFQREGDVHSVFAKFDCFSSASLLQKKDLCLLFYELNWDRQKTERFFSKLSADCSFDDLAMLLDLIAYYGVDIDFNDGDRSSPLPLETPTCNFFHVSAIISEIWRDLLTAELSSTELNLKLFKGFRFLEMAVSSAISLCEQGWDFHSLYNWLSQLSDKSNQQVNLVDFFNTLSFAANYQKFIPETRFYEVIEDQPMEEVINILFSEICEDQFADLHEPKERASLLREIQFFSGITCEEWGFTLSEMEECLEVVDRFYSQPGRFLLPIQEWSKDHIMSWASNLTGSREGENPPPPSSSSPSALNRINGVCLTECLAVLKRAIVLTFPFDSLSVQLDVQLLAVWMLSQKASHGILSQISTGEGKSIVIAMIAVVKALEGKTVDIITSSSILAKRDVKNYQPFYQLFGLKASAIEDSHERQETKPCYASENAIVYGDPNQFRHDILRDIYSGLNTRGGRQCSTVIIDEADSVLVDGSEIHARLSSPTPGMQELNPLLIHVWLRVLALEELRVEPSLDPQEFNDPFAGVDRDDIEAIKDVVVGHLKEYILMVVENGIVPIPRHLNEYVMHQADQWAHSAYLAYYLYRDEKQYLIKINKEEFEFVAPVDFANTGTVQMNTSWESGLQQFLQIRHSLAIESLSHVTNFLSIQAFMRKYSEWIGLTGTLGSNAVKSFIQSSYQFDCLEIPTMLCGNRQELTPLIFDDEEVWLQAIAFNSVREARMGRVVLIICETIENTEALCSLVKTVRSHDKGPLYLYRDDERESAQFFEKIHEGNTIIISTNLAGRGVDIRLSREVILRGGLHVCMTFLPVNSRVAQQAFGRASRRGEPGTFQLVLNKESVVEQLPYATPDELESLDRDAKMVEVLRDREESRTLASLGQRLEETRRQDDRFDDFLKLLQRIESWSSYGLLFPELEGESAIFQRIFEDELKQVKKSAVEEEWGWWLIEKSSTESFETFEHSITRRYRDHSIITNPIYYIQLGNRLLEHATPYDHRCGNAFYRGAYLSYQKAIDLDPTFSYNAYYHQAFILMQMQESGYKGKARTILQDLERILRNGPIQTMNDILGVLDHFEGDKTEDSSLQKYDLKKDLQQQLHALTLLLVTAHQMLEEIQHSQSWIELGSFSPLFGDLSVHRFKKEEALAWLREVPPGTSLYMTISPQKNESTRSSSFSMGRIFEPLSKTDKITLTYHSERLYSDLSSRYPLGALLPINRFRDGCYPREIDEVKVSLTLHGSMNPKEILDYIPDHNAYGIRSLKVSSEHLNEMKQRFPTLIVVVKGYRTDSSNGEPQLMRVAELDVEAVKEIEISILKIARDPLIEFLEFLSEPHLIGMLTLVICDLDQTLANLVIKNCYCPMSLNFVDMDRDQACSISSYTSFEEDEVVMTIASSDVNALISSLEHVNEREKDVVVSHRSMRSEISINGSLPPSIIDRHQLNGYSRLFNTESKRPIPWREVGFVTTLSAAQMIAGYFINRRNPKDLRGLGLMFNGLSDAMTAAVAIHNRKLESVDYVFGKAGSVYEICQLNSSSQKEVIATGIKRTANFVVDFSFNTIKREISNNLRQSLIYRLNRAIDSMLSKNEFQTRLHRLFAVDDFTHSGDQVSLIKLMIDQFMNTGDSRRFSFKFINEELLARFEIAFLDFLSTQMEEFKNCRVAFRRQKELTIADKELDDICAWLEKHQMIDANGVIHLRRFPRNDSPQKNRSNAQIDKFNCEKYDLTNFYLPETSTFTRRDILKLCLNYAKSLSKDYSVELDELSQYIAEHFFVIFDSNSQTIVHHTMGAAQLGVKLGVVTSSCSLSEKWCSSSQSIDIQPKFTEGNQHKRSHSKKKNKKLQESSTSRRNWSGVSDKPRVRHRHGRHWHRNKGLVVRHDRSQMNQNQMSNPGKKGPSRRLERWNKNRLSSPSSPHLRFRRQQKFEKYLKKMPKHQIHHRRFKNRMIDKDIKQPIRKTEKVDQEMKLYGHSRRMRRRFKGAVSLKDTSQFPHEKLDRKFHSMMLTERVSGNGSCSSSHEIKAPFDLKKIPSLARVQSMLNPIAFTKLACGSAYYWKNILVGQYKASLLTMGVQAKILSQTQSVWLTFSGTMAFHQLRIFQKNSMGALISLLLLEEKGSDFSLDQNILKKAMTSVLSECHQFGGIIPRLCKIGESSKQYDAQDYLKHLHSIWETDRVLANLERSNRSNFENDFQKFSATRFQEGIEQHDYSKLGKLLFMDKNIMGAVVWLLSDLMNEGFSMRRMTDFEQQNARSLMCRLAQRAIGQHTELQKRIHEIRDQRISFSGMINDELFHIAQTISENYKGFLERLLGVAAEDNTDRCLERLERIKLDFEAELENSNRRVSHRREICQDLEEIEFLDLCEQQARQVVSETLALAADVLKDFSQIL